MNICLIYPTSYHVELGTLPPLGLSYLAAVLKDNGHKVIIVDRDVLRRKGKNADEFLQNTLKEYQPELIGITATTPLIIDAYHCAKISKKILPNAKIVIGGTHATILPFEVLKDCPDIDVVVIGEGEITLSELADGKRLNNILGIGFRQNGKVMVNKLRPFIPDIDSLPLPERQLLDMDFYLRPSVRVIRGTLLKATHIFTARGCPFKCTFCTGQAIFGHKVRFHSADRVINEIEHLVSSYGIDGLFFAEDMFLADKTRAFKICNELIKRRLNKKVAWSAQLSVKVVTKDLLEIMKKAGCIQVEYGFESGSQRMLNLMKKNTTVEENYRAAKLTKEAGLRIMANILVNIPGQTKEDFIKDIEFIRNIRPHYVALNKFIPFPGSQMFKEIVQKGMLPNNWKNFHVIAEKNKEMNFSNMSNEEFWELYNNFTKRFIMPRALVNSIKFLFWDNLFKTIKRILQNPILILEHLLFVIKRIFHNIIRK